MSGAGQAANGGRNTPPGDGGDVPTCAEAWTAPARRAASTRRWQRTQGWGEPRSPAEASSSQEKRARERWAEALYAETALHELRKRNHRFRQVLASLQLKLQPFPGGPSVPAASGSPPGPEAPREAGRSRWQGSGLQAHVHV